MRKATKDQFVEKANKRHNFKYDYSKSIYIDSYTKLKIMCPDHGEFECPPNAHVQGRKCFKCGLIQRSKSRTISWEDVREKLNKRWDNKYDYSEANYTGSQNKIKIICPVHGSFTKNVGLHLKKQGCPKCSWDVLRDERKHTFESFCERANKVHNNKYTYKDQENFTIREKLRIVCSVHGDFFQVGANHLQGQGCKKCRYPNFNKNPLEKRKKRKTFNEFVEEANKIHNCKYKYIENTYTNPLKKIGITCEKHGIFYKEIHHHIKRKQGCPKCSEEIHGQDKITPFYDFVKKANLIHGNKYQYIQDEYFGGYKPIGIICPIHNKFYQNKDNHLKGCECPKCGHPKGKDNPMWNPNLTDEERQSNKGQRLTLEYARWRKSVYKRDNYTCQITGIKGGKICSHHIESYHANKQLRTEITNGITLSEKIHKLFHKLYGKTNNTKFQLEDFRQKIKKGEINVS